MKSKLHSVLRSGRTPQRGTAFSGLVIASPANQVTQGDPLFPYPCDIELLDLDTLPYAFHIHYASFFILSANV